MLNTLGSIFPRVFFFPFISFESGAWGFIRDRVAELGQARGGWVRGCGRQMWEDSRPLAPDILLALVLVTAPRTLVKISSPCTSQSGFSPVGLGLRFK